MQNRSLTYVRKRYCKTFTLEVAPTKDRAFVTLSHIGAKNLSDPGNTLSLTDVDQDQQLTADMDLYQFAKITGIAWKLIFPPPTTPEATPVEWSCGYSNNSVIFPEIDPARLQTLAAYQTGGCDPTKSVSRYFRTTQALLRQGVEWFDTLEYPQFGTNGGTYNDQLLANSGSSTQINVYRSAAAVTTKQQLARLEVIYYVTYKGTKGQNSITAP